MQIRPRSTHRTLAGTLVLLACACSFDPAGIATVDQSGSSGTAGTEVQTAATDATSDPTVDPTVDPTTTTGMTSDMTTGPTTAGPTTTPAECGNGMIEGGEQCDNGTDNDNAASCKEDCTDNTCGDGFVGPGEGCDDGNQVDDDECSLACVSKNCGNNEMDDGEECDDGNKVDDDGCTNACTAPACGDQILQMGEECDEGAGNGMGQTCKGDCKKNVCGDGDKGPGEGCDDGNMTDGDGCAASCTPEVCGDGVPQGGEECDDGNDVETDACTTLCKNAVCGDLKIYAGMEECDDGNSDDTDACVACKNAKCGDGKVKASSDEECDDGNQNNDDACSNGCKPNFKRVFVTSAEYPGNLGGLAGADKKCNDLAGAVLLPGVYMAWISLDANNTAPATRFPTKANFPYQKPNGEKIADNWGDLIDGTLAKPIDVYENGSKAADEVDVWTNVAPNGTQDGGDPYECNDWSSSDGNAMGSYGDRTKTDGGWTDQNLTEGCNHTKRLYCFQQ